MSKLSRGRNTVLRSGLQASGVTEPTEQDGVFDEAKKSGLKAIALTPIQWISSSVTNTVLFGMQNLASLQDTLEKTAVALTLSGVLSVGQTVLSKIGEAREASKKMVEDRKAGKDPDTPIDDQVHEHDENIASLNKRHRRTFALFGKVVRSLKDGQNKTNERVDTVENAMGDDLDQRIQAKIDAALARSEEKHRAEVDGIRTEHRTEVTGLRGEIASLRANTAGQFEAMSRQTDERIGAQERRTDSALNAHLSHVDAELESVREQAASHTQRLGRHDAQLADHADLITEAAEVLAIHGERLSTTGQQLAGLTKRVNKHATGLEISHAAFRDLEAKVEARTRPPTAAPAADQDTLLPGDGAKVTGLLENAQILRDRARRRSPHPAPAPPPSTPQPPQPKPGSQPGR
jgi:chromosome segregation ATPase